MVSAPMASCSADEVEYYRYASDALMELVREEDQRHSALEKKATLAATVSLVVSAYSSQSLATVITSFSLAGALVGMIVCAVSFSLIYSYRTHAIAKRASISPRQFVDPKILQESVAQRLCQLSSHLAETLTGLRQAGERKAAEAYRAQQWAIVGAVCSLILVLTSRMKV